jgi:hypothetical protein
MDENIKMTVEILRFTYFVISGKARKNREKKLLKIE